MKTILFSAFIILSTQAFSREVYRCQTFGPDMFLTFHDENTITLHNSIKNFNCLRGYENFPGTEVDLNILTCSRKSEKLKFYFTQYDSEEIILSRNIIFSKDISCLKE